MQLTHEQFESNFRRIRSQIEAACGRSGRDPQSVRLLPVTKNHPVEAARYAWRSGLTAVGENRVQEALGKMGDADPGLEWELIGPLQSNKAKRVAESFARVQTVERAKIALALDRYAAEAGRALPVLIQVNAGRDPAKSGIELEDAEALAETVAGCANLRIDGLMTIAPLSEDRDVARRCFANLRECRDRLSSAIGRPLLELSMGMSDDLEEAILEGSTLVRVGTALYGKRNY